MSKGYEALLTCRGADPTEGLTLGNLTPDRDLSLRVYDSGTNETDETSVFLPSRPVIISSSD